MNEQQESDNGSPSSEVLVETVQDFDEEEETNENEDQVNDEDPDGLEAPMPTHGETAPVDPEPHAEASIEPIDQDGEVTPHRRPGTPYRQTSDWTPEYREVVAELPRIARTEETTIEFDDSEPLRRPARRSTNSMNNTIREARRQSNVAFSSPPQINRTHRSAPPTLTKLSAAGGNGGDDDDGSVSSSSSDATPQPSRPPKPPKRGPNGEPRGPQGPPPNWDPLAPNAGGGGGGGGGGDDSSNGSQGPRCTLCGGAHLTRHCPRTNNRAERCWNCGDTTHRIDDCDLLATNGEPNDLIIDGRVVRVRDQPRSTQHFQKKRTWNKLLRHEMTPEEHIAFEQKATGYVLSKHNKLRVQSHLNQDDDVLKNVYNLQYQLKALRDHVTNYDLMDVFTIVVPVDILNGPGLRRKKYNLFDDYPKLTAEMVANSSAYYNMWADGEYILENLNLSYSLIKNNTDDTLFNKCLESYEMYHKMQQGGPLILQLVLQKIHNTSEQFMEHLKSKVENLDISKIEGENVDTAVSLINAAYQAFRSASTSDNDRVPPEWPKTLIHVFQTTSVSTFNIEFIDEERRARREADKHGGQPEWPTHEELVSMATTLYNRLKRTGHWDIPKSARSKAYNINLNRQRPPGKPGSSGQGYTRKCWNCGSTDHMLNDCTAPRDENKIAKARQQFRQNRGPRQNQRRGPPKHKTVHGKPLVLNKNQVYVLDQKRLRSQKEARLQTALQALTNPSHSPTPTGLMAHHDPEPQPADAPQESPRIEPSYVQNILRGLL